MRPPPASSASPPCSARPLPSAPGCPSNIAARPSESPGRRDASKRSEPRCASRRCCLPMPACHTSAPIRGWRSMPRRHTMQRELASLVPPPVCPSSRSKQKHNRGHTHLVVIVRPLRVQLFPTQVAASIPNRSRFFMGCHPPSPLVNPLLNGGKIKTLRPPLCVPHGHLMWLQPSVLREVGSPPQAAASRRAFGTWGTCRTTLGPLENL